GTEGRVGDRQLGAIGDLQFHRYFLPLASAFLFGVMLLRSASRAALTDGRTITSPPSAPGTAPLISSRLRATSISITLRFSVVRRTTPMWPAIRLPLKTRPGVWRMPIEPGARRSEERRVGKEGR